MKDRNQFHKVMADECIGTPPVNGVVTAELHRDAFEIVTYSELDAGAILRSSQTGGLEMLVLAGCVSVTDSENGEMFAKGGWLRLPEGQPLVAVAGSAGAKIWLKTGHIAHAKSPEI